MVKRLWEKLLGVDTKEDEVFFREGYLNGWRDAKEGNKKKFRERKIKV